MARGENLFRLSTEPLEAALEGLPTVADAEVGVRSCRRRLVVTLERARAGPRLAGRRAALPRRRRRRAVRAGSATIRRPRRPTARHRRPPGGVGRAVGRAPGSTRRTSTPRPASRRSCRPTSAAPRRRWPSGSPTTNGFVVRADPQGWLAIFGFYTPSLRTPELIPGQVRLLRSLLIGREPLIARVILASETDGTYVPKPTPTPTRASPAP